MTDLIIDPEFRDLIPPLSDDEKNGLERNILQYGVRVPLDVWQGTLIDGHNRYEIAKRHNLPFKTAEMQFNSRDDVICWIIDNQLDRRNLPPAMRIKLALRKEPILAAKAKENSLANLKKNTECDKCRTPEDTQPATKEKNKVKRENKTTQKVAQIAGVSDKTVERYKKIQQSAPEEVKAKVDSGEISINAAYKKIKVDERKQTIQKQAADIEQKNIAEPDGLFNVIVIDPAWNYGTHFSHANYRGNTQYPEMSQDELKAIELPADDNCVLFLWTTHKFIWDAKELLDHWGFDYRCLLVWDKQSMGMGGLIRMQCEFCLIGIKGKPTFKDVHNIRDLITEQRREHSRKPESFYRLVDELCYGRKLDYFSRTQREGWISYGNDTNKFIS